jgi:hypothetical protein
LPPTIWETNSLLGNQTIFDFLGYQILVKSESVIFQSHTGNSSSENVFKKSKYWIHDMKLLCFRFLKTDDSDTSNVNGNVDGKL